MPSIPTCFFAYSSQPPDLAETIENAISDMNASGGVKVQSWKQFSAPGRIVLSEVCRGIDASDILACDLTQLNTNVLFELGYAVAKRKHVWLVLDPSVRRAKENYDKLGVLSTIIHVPYHNHNELAAKLLTDVPEITLRQSLLETIFQSAEHQPTRPPTLFYLKSEINTEASDRLARRIRKSGASIDVDDPDEIPSQTLAWYVEHTYHSFAVVVHFLGDDRSSKLLQNQKYSFVAGMAHGLGKKLLMLAHEPFVPGMDYKDLLHKHRTASDCMRLFDAWLATVKAQYDAQAQQFERREVEAAAVSELQSLNLGDHLAENERLDIPEYFVFTAAYSEALQGRPTMLFVGRKGTGKTANLVELSDNLRQDHRYHVCVIEPPAYEQTSVLRLLSETSPLIERSYAAESLWKFLIETELAKSVYDEILSRPTYSGQTDDETEFIRYMEASPDLLKADFAVRMENAILLLLDLDPSQSIHSQRAKLSEILHREVLAQLREHLGRVLGRRKKVFVLVDNLDKAWTRKSDIPYLSEFLFGLLGVSRAISEEFGRAGQTWRRVALSLIIFLRSDIFARVMAGAREPDKIEWIRVDWNDPVLLQRVVEERILTSAGGGLSRADLWERFFVPSVKGIPTKDYIVGRIIPRPRDIIYFCKAALACAINRRHIKVEEDDILTAEKQYSYFALESLVAETTIQVEQIEDLLLLFAESPQIMTRRALENIARDARIPESRAVQVIQALIEYGFLGLETGVDQFEFIHDEPASKLARAKATNLAATRKQRGEDQRFKINVAYHAWLQIREGGISD